MKHLSLVRRLGYRQALRLGWMNMTLALYITCFAIAWFCSRAGMVALEPILYAMPIAVAVNLALHGMVISGLNLRFRDPSLALPQLAVATVFIMYGAYHADEARPIFLLLYTVPFLFGAFRLPAAQHILTAVFALACHAFVIYIAMRHRPDSIHLTQESLQWATQALVLLSIVAIGHTLRTIRRQASTDQLTGVLNRHQIVANLQREQERCNRGAPAFCVCFLDVDHLKAINDHLGHGIGDELLRRLANEIGERLRGMDDFGRFGGDEFIIALPGTQVDGALRICARMQERIRTLKLGDLGIARPVTVSIGVAESRPGESIDALLGRADEALYRAKRTGRDRVVSFADAESMNATPANRSLPLPA